LLPKKSVKAEPIWSAARGNAAMGISTGCSSAGGTVDADCAGIGAAMSMLLDAGSAISTTGKTGVNFCGGATCFAIAHNKTTIATIAITIAIGHATFLDVYFKAIL
jgi:hypothetical protein